MNKDNIKCICGNEFEEKKFKKHFRNCNSFLNKFYKFDYKISRLLDEYIVKKEYLLLVRFLVKRYIKRIDEIIKQYKNEINYNIMNKEKNLGKIINDTDEINIQGNENEYIKNNVNHNFISNKNDCVDTPYTFKNSNKNDKTNNNKEELPKDNQTPMPMPDNFNQDDYNNINNHYNNNNNPEINRNSNNNNNNNNNNFKNYIFGLGKNYFSLFFKNNNAFYTFNQEKI